MIVLITAIISPFLSIKSVRKTRTLQFVEKVYHIKRRTFPRLPLTRELSPDTRVWRLRER